MIASSRKPTLSPAVTRHFEFTRLQGQLIALAYQALIPVISCPAKTAGSRLDRNQTSVPRRSQSKARGA